MIFTHSAQHEVNTAFVGEERPTVVPVTLAQITPVVRWSIDAWTDRVKPSDSTGPLCSWTGVVPG